MRMTQFIILHDMKLVRRPDKRAVLIQVDLHDTQSRRMARGMVERDTLVKIELRVRERAPVQLLQEHVMAQIHAEIGACGDCPAGVLEFLFVDVDWHACVDEVFETAGVVEVKVAHYDGFDVFDVVAGGFYCCGEFLVFRVLGSREDVCYGGWPFLGFC